MASNPRRIPIPLGQRLRRLRYRVLPIFTFAGAVALTIMLWGKHKATPNAIGAVDAVRYDILSPADGRLVWEGTPLDLFDQVHRGQVIARLDDGPLRAELVALKGDLAEAHAKITAAEAEARLDDDTRNLDRLIDQRRIGLDVQRMRLTMLDRRAELEIQRITLERREEQLVAMKRLVDSNAATEVEYLGIKLERDAATQRVKSLEQMIEQGQAELEEMRQKLQSLPEAAKTQVDAFTAPLREAAAALDARARALELQAKELTIQAPAAGVVAAVFRRPGQFVSSGDYIITIADPTARRVVAYVRPEQRVDPKPGMEVVIRSRTNPRDAKRSRISIVGPQVESVPSNQLRSSNIPEWGVPVTIELPPTSDFRPGELVDIVLVR